ncbi:MAG: hypothetical protein R3F61_02230 [Myxococcota bacterium]
MPVPLRPEGVEDDGAGFRMELPPPAVSFVLPALFVVLGIAVGLLGVGAVALELSGTPVGAPKIGSYPFTLFLPFVGAASMGVGAAWWGVLRDAVATTAVEVRPGRVLVAGTELPLDDTLAVYESHHRLRLETSVGQVEVESGGQGHLDWLAAELRRRAHGKGTVADAPRAMRDVFER